MRKLAGIGLMLFSACSYAGKWDVPHKPKIKDYRPSVEVMVENFGETLEEGQTLSPCHAKGFYFTVGKIITKVKDENHTNYEIPRLTLDVSKIDQEFPKIRIKNAEPYITLNTEYDKSLSEGREADSVMVCNEDEVCINVDVDKNVLDLYDAGISCSYHKMNDWEFKVPEEINLPSSFRDRMEFNQE